ncbi:MAG: dihydrolipoamide acetyltransferase family protein [Roseiflexaceae bacterium]
MADITMPKMGFDMTEGTIVRWIKKVGDHVNKGEAVAEIETDKVTIEIESFVSGTITEIVTPEGSRAPVGGVIARTDTAGAATATPAAAPGAAPAAPTSAPVASPAPVAPVVSALSAGTTGGAVKASPIAKRMAREHGLDLATIAGSGPQGRVVRDDVNAVLAGRPASPSSAPSAPVAVAAPVVPALPTAATGSTVVPLSSMRRTITRRLTQSWQTAPHFYITMDVDMGAALALRKQINAPLAKEHQISINDMIVKACGVALAAYPNLNASFVEEGIQLNPAVNVSIAVALDTGLVAPVVTNADSRSLSGISREAKRLIALARDGKLGAENLQGGTFTVSNLGMYGVTEFDAIITPPQCAILAVGAVRRVPVFKGDSDEVIAANLCAITISADHRITDGAEAAKFVGEIRRLLENPLAMLI